MGWEGIMYLFNHADKKPANNAFQEIGLEA